MTTGDSVIVLALMLLSLVLSGLFYAMLMYSDFALIPGALSCAGWFSIMGYWFFIEPATYLIAWIFFAFGVINLILIIQRLISMIGEFAADRGYRWY